MKMLSVNRVLLMSYYLGPGGSERQLTEIARGLGRDEFSPRVGSFYPEGARADELRAAGVPLVSFPVRSLLRPSVFGVAAELRRYVEQEEIDLVHTFDPPSTMFAVPALAWGRRRGRRPVILSSQRGHRELNPGMGRRLLRLTDRWADGIVVNCRYLENHLREDERVPAGKIHLCYNGLNTAVFSPPASRGGGFTIGAAAVFRREKGLDTLLRAFADFRGQAPEARLLLVGGGPLQGELEGLAAELNLGDSCRFVPQSGAMAEWYRRFDVFVLPSHSEALSNALMEAMACGCACVASAVGGNPELVRSGETGLLFRAGDAGELAERLRQLYGQSTEERGAMGERSATWVRQEFGLERAMERMSSIYRKHLGSGVR